jgi:hypothetical protein
LKEPEKITITFNGKISQESIRKFVRVLMDAEKEENNKKNNQSQSDK